MINNSKYKNIIFDLGGVLVYWKPKEIILDLFKNSKEPPLEILEIIDKSESWKGLDCGIITPKQSVEMLSSKFNKEKFAYFLKNIYKYIVPVKDGLDIFNQIKKNGFKTYILSNYHKDVFEKTEPTYDFLKDFDGALYSFKVHCSKPDPQIYKILLNTYSLNVDECLFIDDTPANIEGAKAVGIDGIVCKNYEYIINELKRLKVL